MIPALGSMLLQLSTKVTSCCYLPQGSGMSQLQTLSYLCLRMFFPDRTTTHTTSVNLGMSFPWSLSQASLWQLALYPHKKHLKILSARSNFTGRKFTIYESSSRFDKKPDSKQPPARKSHCKYTVGTVSFSVARNRPRRMTCVMNSIPASFSVSKGKDLASSNFSTANLSVIQPARVSGDPLVLMNTAPWWHEKHRFWCLNFRGRVTVASVKNFQLLLAADQPSGNVSSAEGKKVILQFGKIGADTFTMDYQYPLSAFQAFAICLSSLGSNAYYWNETKKVSSGHEEQSIKARSASTFRF